AHDGQVTRFDLREPPGSSETLVDLSAIGGCTTLAFSPDGTGAFALGCEDPIVRIYDIRSLSSAAAAQVQPVQGYCPLHLVDNNGMRASYDRLSSGASSLAYSASGGLHREISLVVARCECK
ncbi:MAG: hypothetical protein SGPRY_004861, partial [Prymnesium sp.]